MSRICSVVGGSGSSGWWLLCFRLLPASESRDSVIHCFFRVALCPRPNEEVLQHTYTTNDSELPFMT